MQDVLAIVRLLRDLLACGLVAAVRLIVAGENLLALADRAAWERLRARVERPFAAYVESGVGGQVKPGPSERAR